MAITLYDSLDYGIPVIQYNITACKVDATIPFTSQAYTLSAWAGLHDELILLIATSTNHMSMRCTQYHVANINNHLTYKRNYEFYFTYIHVIP